MAGRKQVIGLALGSGGARGWAHLGVLKALKELGIQPDIIAGTSAGAFVGAAYACNRMDALERYALSLTKVGVVKHLLASYSFLSEGGLLEGQRLMEEVMEHILGTRNVEDMPLKFAAVATDIHTGREVWIRRGPLFQAVRASMAVPALISPIRADNRWLMDGALVNPVPVSVCRALGADVVIAVNLNTGISTDRRRIPITKEAKKVTQEEAEAVRQALLKAGIASRISSVVDKGIELINDRLPLPFKSVAPEVSLQLSVFEVALRSIDIMQECITRARMAGEPPEVQISPRLGHLGLMEFYRAADSIAEGFNSTMRIKGILEAELPELFQSEQAAGFAGRNG
eukprot:GGOE01049314.1.p1 GENE.GGOE01049314.1~~GGOE01049314.1.p1  ORF type:complete len:363 (+),score=116.85 GGOE01049314.1:61-1089(+)